MSGFQWTIGGISAEDDSSKGSSARGAGKSASKFLASDRVRGIVNVTGNSCFLNSLLQALAVLPPLHGYLRAIVSAADSVERKKRDALSSLHAKTHGEFEGAGKASTVAVDTEENVVAKKLVWDDYAVEGEERGEVSCDDSSGGVLSSLLASDSRPTAKHIALQLLRMLSTLVYPFSSADGMPFPVSPLLSPGGIHSLFEDRDQHDVHELLIQMLSCLDDDELHTIQLEDEASTLFLEWPSLLKTVASPITSRAATVMHASHVSASPSTSTTAASYAGVDACELSPGSHLTPRSLQNASPPLFSSASGPSTLSVAKMRPVPGSNWTHSLMNRSGVCSAMKKAARQNAAARQSDPTDTAMPAVVRQVGTISPMRGIAGQRVLCEACALPPLEITNDGIAPKEGAFEVAHVPFAPASWIQEALMVLSLSPSPAAVGAGRKYRRPDAPRHTGSSNYASAHSQYASLTVEDLLAHHFRDDPITGYVCENPRCGHINYRFERVSRRIMPLEHNARKQNCLIQLPPILALQVRRSDFHAHSGRATKASTLVSFDWTLDMFPFTMEGKECVRQAGVSEGYYIYDLMSVVQHLGFSSSGGHYVTFRRVPASLEDPDCVAPQWVRTSDTMVDIVSASEVQRAEAYMLFYVRRDFRHPCRLQSALIATKSADVAMQPSVRQLLVRHPMHSVLQTVQQAAMEALGKGGEPSIIRDIVATIIRALASNSAASSSSSTNTPSAASSKLVLGQVMTAFKRLLQDSPGEAAAGTGEGADGSWSDTLRIVWFPTEYE
jgi:hypothetical protein